MKLLISFLLISSLQVFAQEHPSQLILIDTNTNFNIKPISGYAYNDDYVIDQDSIFKAIFYFSKYSVYQPNFNTKIYLKRSIQGKGIVKIRHQFKIDSRKKEIRWVSIIDTNSSETLINRHFIYSIPNPGSDYHYIFEKKYQHVPESKENWKEVKSLDYKRMLITKDYYSQIDKLMNRQTILDPDTLSAQKRKELNSFVLINSDEFSGKIITGGVFWGDCMLQLTPNCYWDNITNTLLVDVYNIWGGCRAGGSDFLYLVIDKPQTEKYDLLLNEINVESQTEYEQSIQK